MLHSSEHRWFSAPHDPSFNASVVEALREILFSGCDDAGDLEPLVDDGIVGTGVVGPTTPSRCRYLDRIRDEEAEEDEQVEFDIVDFVSADE